MMDTQNKNKFNNKYKRMHTPEATLKLVNSASEQNVYFTYVCMVNDIKPSAYEREHGRSFNCLDGEPEEIDQEDQPIQVERSKALHELVESHRKSEFNEKEKAEADSDSSTPYPLTTSGEDSEASEIEDNPDPSSNGPNILKLTKMKWLTEDQEGSPDSSSPSISPANSSSSTNCSRESEEELGRCIGVSDKYLSTILRLDKEHNLFGLSNIAIVGSRPSRKIRREDEKPVFPQTAIVQVCCGNKCCKHMSKTDLPASLKCGGCRGCCLSPACLSCGGPCPAPNDPPCTPLCSSCPMGKCSCKGPCKPKCLVDCTTCYGLKILLNRKPKYEPAPIELTPRSSCVLQKPLAARSCHHIPQCIPPSSCFPYLMPCFWPARPGAPCNTPTHCFHNPPCRAPRRPAPGPKSPDEICPRDATCGEKIKCPNQNCPGNNPIFKKEFESRFGKQRKL